MPTSTDAKRPPSRLQAIYKAKQRRSLGLVQASIQQLVTVGKNVSVASIMSTSREVDPEGRGVSRNAILENERCRTLYERHRAWKELHPAKRRRAARAAARKHLARLSKDELIERIAALEQDRTALEQANIALAAENLRLRLQARKN